MKNLRIALIGLLIAVLVAGCSEEPKSTDSKSDAEESSTSEGSTAPKSENPLRDLMDKDAELESTWLGLPGDFREEVFVPQMNTIPFAVDAVDVFTLGSSTLPPGVKTNFDIILKAKNSFPRIHVTAFDVADQKPLFGKYTSEVELKKDIQGYYTEEEQQKEISWVNKDKTIQYLIRYMEGQSKEVSISKEQLIKMANSMIEQIN